MKIDRELSRIAIEHYGVGQELLIVTEEVGELLQAISKMSRETKLFSPLSESKPARRETRNNLITEIADTYIVLEHVKEIFSISDSEVQEEINQKQSRLLWRILSETDSNIKHKSNSENDTE